MSEAIEKEYLENNKFIFETVSPAKIIALSLATGGLYHIILAYNYWRQLKQRADYKVSPFWRGIFLGFTNFKLFPIINDYIKKFNQKPFSAEALAIVFFIINGTANRIEFKSMKLDTTNWAMEAASWLLIAILTAIFVIIQNKINAVNKTFFPNARKNSWRLSNTIWFIISLLILVLGYLPD